MTSELDREEDKRELPFGAAEPMKVAAPDTQPHQRLHASDWRILALVTASSLLPLLIYALITLSASFRDQQRTTQSATLARAARIMDAVDARLEATSATLRVLATIRSIRERNWEEAHQRSAEIARLDPDWRSVAFIDLASRTELFDLRRPPGQTRPIAPHELAGIPIRTDRPFFTDIVRGSDGQMELGAYLAVPGARGPRYLIRVALDPGIAQRILIKMAPAEGVSAVVDRHGRFIARTKDWRQRLGGPATVYVRSAIRQGSSGMFRSVTYEGFRSYTGFSKSRWTGWSSHVAASRSLIDGANRGSWVATALAAIVSMVLAFAIAAITIRSIRIRRAARVRMEQAERLETVGQLTGGVAHDFNNMLAIVMGSLDMAQRRIARGDHDIGHHLGNAMDGARRAADLTKRLLAFSRRQPLTPKPLDVNVLIEGMLELLRRAVGENIGIELRLEANLWPTLADPGQLENALINLAVNARDAMPDGGMLTIATMRWTAGDGKGELRDGDYVLISVRDDGTGMPPDVAARAFEPFYTTKEVGRGTGLGLSQIHGFAVQTGGTAKIASRLGSGTSVDIYLPRLQGDGVDTVVPSATAPPPEPQTAAGKLILLVEDDAHVRDVHAAALRTLGYTIIEAKDGEQACNILGERSDIALLLTDIIMPGMSGRDLAARVAVQYPDVAILMVSGFDQRHDADDDYRVLRKPFTLDELSTRIRQALGQRRRP